MIIQEKHTENEDNIVGKRMKEDAEGTIKSRIDEAMRSRVQHFRDQAESLTFEGVRRLLEKDLVLDTYALDVHKGYVKQLLEKYLNGTEDDDNNSKDSGQIKLEQVKEEGEKLPKEHQMAEDVKEIRSEDEGKMKDSPVMGLLTGNESAKSGDLENQGIQKDAIPNEVMVKTAIWRRAAYLRSKSEEITMAGVRRLLEEDLELHKFSLDSFKELISKQLDEVLNSSENPESATPVKRKTSLNSQSATPHKISAKKSTASSDSESDEKISAKKSTASDSESDDEEIEVKPKKKVAPKGKGQISEGSKKRRRPAKETQRTRKKQIKLAEETSEEKKNSQDDEEESSAEKSGKEVVPSLYGKKVEHLKSIIRSCGMTVAPSIYKKAKQAPEDKREAFIIKELKEILSKEGLSANPSEKEIKEVKRRKERAKELEGIDTSNIVLGSRRRSTANFVATPKPKEPVESDEDDSDDTDNEESNDEDEDDGNTSHSEEVHEDMDDSD